MQPNSGFSKFLRFIGIVLMGLTGVFTLLGGAGTTCAALFPTNYDSMAPLAPFQWLYVLFVLLGLVIGVAGIRATVMLVRGAGSAYRDAMLTLLAGCVAGLAHIVASRALRGSSMPVDAVVYVTVFTLLVFLLFRIPWVWQGVDFSQGRRRDNHMAGGAAAIASGLLTLTIQFTMATTHTWGGVNYADAFHAALTLTGAALLLAGALLLALAGRPVHAGQAAVLEAAG